jgi:hypothetical protein
MEVWKNGSMEVIGVETCKQTVKLVLPYFHSSILFKVYFHSLVEQMMLEALICKIL